MRILGRSRPSVLASKQRVTASHSFSPAAGTERQGLQSYPPPGASACGFPAAAAQPAAGDQENQAPWPACSTALSKPQLVNQAGPAASKHLRPAGRPGSSSFQRQPLNARLPHQPPERQPCPIRPASEPELAAPRCAAVPVQHQQQGDPQGRAQPCRGAQVTQAQTASQPAPDVSLSRQAQGASCPAAAQEQQGVHRRQTRASVGLTQHIQAAQACSSEQGSEASGSSSDADADSSCTCEEDDAASCASAQEVAPEPAAPKPNPKRAPARKRRSAAPCMHSVSSSLQQRMRVLTAAQLAFCS